MVGLIAKVLIGSSTLGLGAGVIALSTLDALLQLVEDGLLGMQAPSSLRNDITALKGTFFRRINAANDILDGEALIRGAKARRLVAEAAQIENATSGHIVSIGPGGFSRELPEAIRELKKAAQLLKSKGARVTVDSPGLTRRRASRLLAEGDTTGDKTVNVRRVKRRRDKG